MYGKKISAYKVLVRNTLLGTHRHRWDGNIKVDMKEIWCEDVNWI
jgi:hypothetical protein